jgi:alpha-amylase
VNIDQVGWSAVNFWSWGGDDSHAPKNNNWPGDKITSTTEVGGKTWYTQSYTINNEYDAVSFVFSTGSGNPQTVDVTNVTTDKFFEISTSKEGEKHLVNDVTAVYTAISPVITDAIGNGNVYSLDGRLVRTDGKLENLPKGIYIVNKKKVILK